MKRLFVLSWMLLAACGQMEALTPLTVGTQAIGCLPGFCQLPKPQPTARPCDHWRTRVQAFLPKEPGIPQPPHACP